MYLYVVSSWQHRRSCCHVCRCAARTCTRVDVEVMGNVVLIGKGLPMYLADDGKEVLLNTIG